MISPKPSNGTDHLFSSDLTALAKRRKAFNVASNGSKRP
jgi:hypothetical protein